MKSYAHEDLPRKKIKKYAARFSDEEVRATLSEDAEHRLFIFEFSDTAAGVMTWSATDGPMIHWNDDAVLNEAQVQYLRRHGYPVARSDEEVQLLADQHGWPRSGLKAQRKPAAE